MKDNKLINVIEIAFQELALTHDNVILLSETECYNKNNTSVNIVKVSKDLSIQKNIGLDWYS